MNDLYLEHHGIKGQRWGIRRFQNYDGTYTQEGLARYNESLKRLNNAKSDYEKAKQTGDSVKIAKASEQRRIAQAEEKKAYKDLKNEKLRDQGKQLYEKGKTIESIENGRRRLGKALAAVGIVSSAAVAITDQSEMGSKGKARTYAAIIALDAAASAGAGIAYAKNMRDEKKMRTYWHQRGK